MFENVNVEDRIHLVHRATGSEIKAIAEHVSPVGSWVDIAPNVTLYAPELGEAGWELVGAESKADRIVKGVMKSLHKGPYRVTSSGVGEHSETRIEEAIRAALEAEDE